MPGRAIKATRLSNRLQPRATRSLRASLVHSLDQSPVHGATVNKELLRTVTNTTRAAQQGAWATRFDAGQAGRRRVPPPGHDRPRPSYGRAQWAKRIRAAVRAAPRRQSNTCKPQALQRGPACSASNEEPAANRRTAVVHASWNARTAPAAGGPIRNALRKAPCKNGVFTWPCSKQCRQMSTRPWAKCTRGASWHCVVHSQINPPSRAKDGARGARASTSSRLAAGVSHTQHAARSGVRSHE